MYVNFSFESGEHRIWFRMPSSINEQLVSPGWTLQVINTHFCDSSFDQFDIFSEYHGRLETVLHSSYIFILF